MLKSEKKIRDLVALMLSDNVPAIYPREIAKQLGLYTKTVVKVLDLMDEEAIVRHVFELHCYVCGHVITASEIKAPFLTKRRVECLGCLTQMGNVSMNNIVSAYYAIDQSVYAK